jgi:hypothetical protein
LSLLPILVTFDRDVSSRDCAQLRDQ